MKINCFLYVATSNHNLLANINGICFFLNKKGEFLRAASLREWEYITSNTYVKIVQYVRNRPENELIINALFNFKKEIKLSVETLNRTPCDEHVGDPYKASKIGLCYFNGKGEFECAYARGTQLGQLPYFIGYDNGSDTYFSDDPHFTKVATYNNVALLEEVQNIYNANTKKNAKVH